MKKILKKYCIIFLVVLVSISCIFISNQTTYATDFFGVAQNWFKGGSEDDTMQTALSDITGELGTMVEIIGTAIIIAATIVLGIRYIFASAEGKSAAKESTMNLLVACILFFGWSNIQNLLYSSTDMTFYLYGNATNVTTATSTIFAVFKFVAQAIALIGILYVGVKYILAGAEGKADLKSKSVPFIIGIILTFAAVNVITIISDLVNLN